MVFAADGPAVHDRDGDAALRRAPEEAVAREDRERRSCHEERVGLVETSERLVDDGARDVLAEEDDPRLERATAVLTRRRFESRNGVVGQVRVAVGCDVRRAAEPDAVGVAHATLNGVAVFERAAPETDHFGQGTVKLGHPMAPGGMMQTVDVLCDDAHYDAGRFEARERKMRRPRAGASKPLPTDHRPRPVAPAKLGRTNEVGAVNRSPGPL